MRSVLFRMAGHAMVVLIASLLISSASTVLAQASRTLANAGRRLDEFNRQSEKVARDELDREMHGRMPTAEEIRRANAKKAQIKKDFEELQSAYNAIVTKLNAKQQLSPAFVSEISNNISKTASRLRENIRFPERKDGDSKSADTPPLATASIKTLCTRIYAFLTSPMLETPAVLDIPAAEKARDVLDDIIRVSENLKHNAGKTN